MDTSKPLNTPAPEAQPDTNGATPANGLTTPDTNGEALEPGRIMSFEEALKHTLEENAELYRRLA